ncbi:MAG: dehalogenase [Chloroflexi bacterium]|nr:dehalogenase [Chloroflexota bacterium]
MLWTLFTIILVVAVTLLVVYTIVKKISVRWWEWLIGGIGLVLLVFALQNFVGALAESENHAAWTFLLTLGIPAIILIALPTVVVMNRNRVEI